MEIQTVILIGALAVVAALAWWINRSAMAEENKKPLDNKRKFPACFGFWIIG